MPNPFLKIEEDYALGRILNDRACFRGFGEIFFGQLAILRAHN